MVDEDTAPAAEKNVVDSSFCDLSGDAAPAAGKDEATAVYMDHDDDTYDEDVEDLDAETWAQMPLLGARVARCEEGALAFGTITSILRIIASKALLYELSYDDGDAEHVCDEQATAALALARELAIALAVRVTTARSLRHRDADAHLRDDVVATTSG